MLIFSVKDAEGLKKGYELVHHSVSFEQRLSGE